jgi:clan AA aspartic protease
MIGVIDDSGRALLTISLQADAMEQPAAIDAWIDTGFTGDLVLPQSVVDQLSLRQSGSVDAVLADGTQVEVNTYTCFVNWFGSQRRLEVVATSGDWPLLGVGLLLGLELRVNYNSMELKLVSS